jgi:hypothetical protein
VIELATTLYDRDGVVHIPGCVPLAMIEAARVEAYDLYGASGGRFGERGSYTQPDGSQLHRTHVHADMAAARPIVVHLPYRAFFPNTRVCLTHSKYSFKPVGAGGDWQPHQDAGYKPGPRRGLTFAVPLEPCNAANGTIEFASKSHRRGKLEHVWAGPDTPQQIRLAEPTDDPFVPFVGAPGDVACFSLYTIHRSGPNTAHGLRAMLFVEIEPCADGLEDDTRGPPLVLP